MGRRVGLMLALALPACRAHFQTLEDGASSLELGDGRDRDLVVAGSLSTSTCFPLVDGSQTTLRFAAVSSFQAGMKLFVWQVQDANVSVSGETMSLANPGDAGHWEIVSIDSGGATDVTLTAPLVHVYSSDPAGTPGRRAQACTIPQYASVTVPAGSALTTPAWNGDSGGVIALFVRGTLDLGGTIDVRGAGFRGGSGFTSDACSSTTELDPVSCAGGKGEGLDGAAWGMIGRGNRANGGGGGDAYNAGAGGGGNGGAGGPGGIECCNMLPSTGGLPGTSLAAQLRERITFGGGGGQGHLNGNPVTLGGGAGGGLVIVHADAIVGTGSIAAGGVVGASVASDGAGGGGAGGSIVVRANASTFTGMLLAPGGAGGDVTDGASNPDVHGPGGGGGGGHVAIEGVPAASIVVLAGANGTDALDPRGAGPGSEGQSER